MEGPRAPLDGEFENVIRFLDSHLRPKAEWSITTEYPVAFSPDNRGNIRIITEQNQVLSHAVMRPMIIKTPVGLFKVAGIGSVVTSSDHRSQGLSSQILDSCLVAARQHGCDFAILWTNLYDFYRRFGFELAGSEISFLLDKDINVANTDLTFKCTPKVAPDAIHRLYSNHTVASLRTLEETRKFLQIPNTRVYTAWDPVGTLKAYAIEGKGADLGGYVHEWGGSVSALVPLFAYARKTYGKPLTIITPKHSTNLIKSLSEFGLPRSDGFLGMIKLLNPSNLFSKVKRHSRALGVADFVIEKQGSFYYIGVGEEIFKTDSESDLIRLIFGPQKASEIYNFDPKTRDVLEKVLPIGMWVWGWDSI